MAKENRSEQLGKLLLEMGLITQEQLQEALGLQEMSGAKNLGDILLKLNLIREEELAYVIGTQLNLPVISLKNVDIPKPVLALIPEKIIKKHYLLPFSLQDNVLTIVMANPMDIMVIDDIQYQTGKQIQEAIGLKSEILEQIGRYFQTSQEEMQQAVQEVAMEAETSGGSDMNARKTVDLEEKDTATVAIVNNIIADAIKMKASDIHIEPHEHELGLRYRLDGVLQERNLKLALKTQGELISRIKLLSNMDISEKRVPQDGRMKVSTVVGDKKIAADLRVSSLPIYRGEKICIRILDKSNLSLNLKDVGFSDFNLKIFEQVVDKPSGIILMTGPTGSGKTSTLYAALNFVSSPEINITTVEDPVEFEIPTFNQTNVQAKIGMTFARALKAILRQDPDVILIGEIRDEETAKIAVEAALTGHLVFSTLHTNDAPSSISRLVEMGVEPYMLSSTVRGIVAQRLLRRLCIKCKSKVVLEANKSDALGKTYGINPPTIFKPKGCGTCNGTGHKGRIAIHEILTFNDELAQAVNDEKSTTELSAIAKRTGFKPLAFDGYVKVMQGVTTFREVEKVAMT
jgi:type IV pilus assembly protein PilB